MSAMKSEKEVSLTTSVDSWLDEKIKLDGAEGLWRIHDKLYDFTVWSRIHPGGKFWIDISRGIDITEAFESHHFSKEAESQLQRYYIREAPTKRNTFTVFPENGLYKALKRKIIQKRLVSPNTPSLTVRLMNDGLVVAVFVASLLGTKYGIQWTVVSGLLLGLLSTFSHSFFHTKDNWRVNYFDLSLMSSRDWRVRHVLSHHQYRNTGLDLEIPVWRPLLKNQEGFAYYLGFFLNSLVFPVVAHLQFLQRVGDVFFSKKLGFYREELTAFSLPLFMFVFGGFRLWEVFVTWNIIVLISSFLFCFLGSSFHIQEKLKSEREVKDFGVVQLSNFRGHPKDQESIFSFLNSFRGNVLHYLSPASNCGFLRRLFPAFDEVIEEFGYEKSSESFLGGLREEMAPQGHVFFS